MQEWERLLTEALAETPPWQGDPEQLWAGIARRIGRRPPWYARRYLLPVAAAAAALVAAVGLGSVRQQPPAPAGLPPDLAVATRVLVGPEMGLPLRFDVEVGTQSHTPVRLNGGRLEVRSAGGEVVWHTALPELVGRELRGPGSVRLELEGPRAPRPGYYRAGVSLVAVGPAGEQADVAGGVAEFFVPFPSGTVRVGRVVVGRTLTRGSVAATLDQITMADNLTTLHFTLEGEGLAGGFQWRLMDPKGNPYPHLATEYRQEGPRLVGEARFEPTLATVPALLVRLERVALFAPGARVVELPYQWEWLVDLDK